MILAGSIIILFYLIALGIVLYGYFKVREYTIEGKEPRTTFSILIPFRNEAIALPDLLKSIENLKYPRFLFEIIFIDDESEDDSVELIKNYISAIQSDNELIHFKIITNEPRSASPKKDAITTAINIAAHDWILTTDADCILPEKWLLAFDDFIQKDQPKMVAAPVRYFSENKLINQYQQMDNFSLQTTTIGGFGLKTPLLCNGANLAYQKKEFKAVEGFLNNDHIASGDDIFLMEKFKKRDPKGIHFIKNTQAIVLTRPQESWDGIIKQRIRWASKTNSKFSEQNNSITKLLGITIFLCNLFILLIGLYSLFENSFFPYFILFLILKSLIDFLFLVPTVTFFKTKINIPHFLITVLIYPIITVIVVFGSLKGTYNWKGRTFKK